MKSVAGVACVAVLLLGSPSAVSPQQCTGTSRCVEDAPADCKVDFERRYRVFGCTASVEASWSGLSGDSESASCIANPPMGYLLWDIDQPPAVSSNNGTYTISRLVNGLEFRYQEEVEDAYKEALDVASKIADEKQKVAVEARINSDWNRHRRIVQNVQTNKDTVRVDVSARTHGSAFDRKRGWEEVTVYLLVGCAAPRNLRDQLLDKYQLTDQLTNVQHSITFENGNAGKRYLAWKAVTTFQRCNAQDTTSPVSSIGIDGRQKIELPIDISLSVCYAVGTKIGEPKAFENACRAQAGDSVALGQDPKCNY